MARYKIIRTWKVEANSIQEALDKSSNASNDLTEVQRVKVGGENENKHI